MIVLFSHDFSVSRLQLLEAPQKHQQRVETSPEIYQICSAAQAEHVEIRGHGGYLLSSSAW